MPDLPKIVRQRLKATEAVAGHPDPNLLTAFSENLLPARERSTVLDHLARCTDCREILALALPSIDEAQTTLTPKRSSWLTWPALRWGLVAAGVATIASLGIVRYQHENRSETPYVTLATPESAKEAKNQVASSTALSAPADKAIAAPIPAPAAASRAKKREPIAQPETRRETLSARTVNGLPPQHTAPIPAPPAAPASPGLVGQPSPASKDLRVPAASETVEVSGANPQVEVVQNQPVSAQAQYDSAEPAVGKAKPAESDQAASNGAGMGGPINAKAHMQLAAAPAAISPAHWNINAGALQRSLDQGRTWQDVNVNAPAVASANLMTVEVEPKAVAKSSRQALKTKAASVPTFRAVAANGPDVWAGGSQGALYHSIDNGNHWTRVTPSTAGSVLTGDVVSVDFPDSLHGKVTTSTPEVWATSDDGQTWQKQ